MNSSSQYTPITITFLGSGTSSGVPMIGCHCHVCSSNNAKDKRLRSSILVQSNTTTVVIDTTPDFRYQMLRINNKRLDAVVFTHPHKDHLGGLDDIRAYNYFQQKAIPIYANALTQTQIKREYYYAFEERKYPGIPQINLITINETDAFTIGNIKFEPILVWHLEMPVLGFKIGNFVYITDANKIDAPELLKIMDADVLVLNALRKETHLSHFTLQQAIELSIQAKAKKTYFTHISHQLGLHNTINEQLPLNMELAYDGLQISL
jgi:phosphoribosyl 1,2-cyclic phosphate phosphodiesterase